MHSTMIGKIEKAKRYAEAAKGLDEDKIVVNELVCQGCGSCAAICPNSASVLRCCVCAWAYSRCASASVPRWYAA